MKNINRKFQVFMLILVSISCSCKNFLEIDPPKNEIVSFKVFENDQIATSAVTGIYSRMVASGSAFSGSKTSINVMSGLSSDELISHDLTLDFYYKNGIPTNEAGIGTLWADAYTYIYAANAILEGLDRKNGVSDGTIKQLKGEAKFIRAFLYFYMVNLFGEVPLNLATDYRTNERGKSSIGKIYSQIITDLVEAEGLLSNSYITTDRIRPNKYTAKALLSRVYLYTQKWDLAVQKATEVIDQNSMYSLVSDLDKVFLKNSTEVIWQLMPTAGGNTQEGATFILAGTPTLVSLSPDLMPLFQSLDNRRTQWTKELTNSTGTYYYPFKYKVRSSSTVTEYSIVIRLAELYIIRAEANAQLNNTALALDDINLIRKRAGMTTPILVLDQVQCLAEIGNQRQLELFSEWGHRWLDLKRTGQASIILSPLKGSEWTDTDLIFPIPEAEINNNPNITQNIGY